MGGLENSGLRSVEVDKSVDTEGSLIDIVSLESFLNLSYLKTEVREKMTPGKGEGGVDLYINMLEHQEFLDKTEYMFYLESMMLDELGQVLQDLTQDSNIIDIINYDKKHDQAGIYTQLFNSIKNIKSKGIAHYNAEEYTGNTSQNSLKDNYSDYVKNAKSLNKDLYEIQSLCDEIISRISSPANANDPWRVILDVNRKMKKSTKIVEKIIEVDNITGFDLRKEKNDLLLETGDGFSAWKAGLYGNDNPILRANVTKEIVSQLISSDLYDEQEINILGYMLPSMEYAKNGLPSNMQEIAISDYEYDADALKFYVRTNAGVGKMAVELLIYGEENGIWKEVGVGTYTGDLKEGVLHKKRTRFVDRKIDEESRGIALPVKLDINTSKNEESKMRTLSKVLLDENPDSPTSAPFTTADISENTDLEGFEEQEIKEFSVSVSDSIIEISRQLQKGQKIDSWDGESMKTSPIDSQDQLVEYLKTLNNLVYQKLLSVTASPNNVITDEKSKKFVALIGTIVDRLYVFGNDEVKILNYSIDTQKIEAKESYNRGQAVAIFDEMWVNKKKEHQGDKTFLDQDQIDSFNTDMLANLDADDSVEDMYNKIKNWIVGDDSPFDDQEKEGFENLEKQTFGVFINKHQEISKSEKDFEESMKLFDTHRVRATVGVVSNVISAEIINKMYTYTNAEDYPIEKKAEYDLMETYATSLHNFDDFADKVAMWKSIGLTIGKELIIMGLTGGLLGLAGRSARAILIGGRKLAQGEKISALTKRFFALGNTYDEIKDARKIVIQLGNIVGKVGGSKIGKFVGGSVVEGVGFHAGSSTVRGILFPSDYEGRTDSNGQELSISQVYKNDLCDVSAHIHSIMMMGGLKIVKKATNAIKSETQIKVKKNNGNDMAKLGVSPGGLALSLTGEYTFLLGFEKVTVGEQAKINLMKEYREKYPNLSDEEIENAVITQLLVQPIAIIGGLRLMHAGLKNKKVASVEIERYSHTNPKSFKCVFVTKKGERLTFEKGKLTDGTGKEILAEQNHSMFGEMYDLLGGYKKSKVKSVLKNLNNKVIDTKSLRKELEKEGIHEANIEKIVGKIEFLNEIHNSNNDIVGYTENGIPIFSDASIKAKIKNIRKVLEDIGLSSKEIKKITNLLIREGFCGKISTMGGLPKALADIFIKNTSGKWEDVLQELKLIGNKKYKKNRESRDEVKDTNTNGTYIEILKVNEDLNIHFIGGTNKVYLKLSKNSCEGYIYVEGAKQKLPIEYWGKLMKDGVVDMTTAAYISQITLLYRMSNNNTRAGVFPKGKETHHDWLKKLHEKDYTGENSLKNLESFLKKYKHVLLKDTVDAISNIKAKREQIINLNKGINQKVQNSKSKADIIKDISAISIAADGPKKLKILNSDGKIVTEIGQSNVTDVFRNFFLEKVSDTATTVDGAFKGKLYKSVKNTQKEKNDIVEPIQKLEKEIVSEIEEIDLSISDDMQMYFNIHKSSLYSDVLAFLRGHTYDMLVKPDPGPKLKMFNEAGKKLNKSEDLLLESYDLKNNDVHGVRKEIQKSFNENEAKKNFLVLNGNLYIKRYIQVDNVPKTQKDINSLISTKHSNAFDKAYNKGPFSNGNTRGNLVMLVYKIGKVNKGPKMKDGEFVTEIKDGKEVPVLEWKVDFNDSAQHTYVDWSVMGSSSTVYLKAKSYDVKPVANPIAFKPMNGSGTMPVFEVTVP